MRKKYDVCWKILGEGFDFTSDPDETNQNLIILMRDISATVSLLKQAQIQLVSTNRDVFCHEAAIVGHCIIEILSALNHFIEVNNHE